MPCAIASIGSMLASSLITAHHVYLFDLCRLLVYFVFLIFVVLQCIGPPLRGSVGCLGRHEWLLVSASLHLVRRLGLPPCGLLL